MIGYQLSAISYQLLAINFLFVFTIFFLFKGNL